MWDGIELSIGKRPMALWEVQTVLRVAPAERGSGRKTSGPAR